MWRICFIFLFGCGEPLFDYEIDIQVCEAEGGWSETIYENGEYSVICHEKEQVCFAVCKPGHPCPEAPCE